MITKWVATQNARKFKTVLQIGVLLLFSSCSKNNDLETIKNDVPINNESGIIHTDIEPDFVSENTNDFYDIDLNHDGIVDFTLGQWTDSYHYLLSLGSSNGGNRCLSIPELFSARIVPLDMDSEISNTASYPNGESYEAPDGFFFGIGDCEDGGSCSYDWKDKNDKYLGLKFFIKGKIHYGWARLDVTSNTQWVIKDYAYNATPNKPILAGQKD